jgi:hypothetical protein
LKVVKNNWVLCVGIIGDCLGVDVRRWSVLLVEPSWRLEPTLFVIWYLHSQNEVTCFGDNLQAPPLCLEQVAPET